jgi:hypothetical protein
VVWAARCEVGDGTKEMQLARVIVVSRRMGYMVEGLMLKA